MILSGKKRLLLSASNRFSVDDYIARTFIGTGAQGLEFPLPFAPDFDLQAIRSTTGNILVADSLRGDFVFATNSTAAQTSIPSGLVPTGTRKSVKKFSSTSTHTVISLSIRKHKRVFASSTYVGDGTSSRAIPHGLPTRPGMVWVKPVSAAGTGYCQFDYTTSSPAQSVELNGTGSASAVSTRFPVPSDATNVTVGSALNTNGVTYIVYAFASDAMSNGICKTGTYAPTQAASSGSPYDVTLGWEPQVFIVKATQAGSNTCDWGIFYNVPGTGMRAHYLSSNNAESSGLATGVAFTATGVRFTASQVVSHTAGLSYAFWAVRKGAQE